MLNILLGCIHVKSWQPPILPPCTSQNWCCAKRLQSLVKCLIIDIQSPGTTGRCRGENQGKFILRLNCNGSTQQQLCWTSTLPSSWQNDCSPTNAAVHSCSDLLQWHLSANVGLYPLRCPTHVNMRLIASPQSGILIETFNNSTGCGMVFFWWLHSVSSDNDNVPVGASEWGEKLALGRWNCLIVGASHASKYNIWHAAHFSARTRDTRQETVPDAVTRCGRVMH